MNYSVLFVDDEINILNSLDRGLMDKVHLMIFSDEFLSNELYVIAEKEFHYE